MKFRAVCIDKDTQKASPGFIKLIPDANDSCWLFESLDNEHKTFLSPLEFPTQGADKFDFDVPPSRFGAYVRLACPPLPGWVNLTTPEPEWGTSKLGVVQTVSLPHFHNQLMHIMDNSRVFYILDPHPISSSSSTKSKPSLWPIKLLKKILYKLLFKK